MTPGRMEKMYGDKPVLYKLSVWTLFLGFGWIIAHWGKLGFGGVFMSLLGWFMVVQFTDAIIKGIILVKRDFSIKLCFKNEA